MKLSKNIKIKLFILLIILNIVLRYPKTPHEIGADSFVIHVLANSISQFGFAGWWLNSLSIFGWYPYSSTSSVPFILSGISQLTEIDMEIIILLFSSLIGVFSIFPSYILAGKIINDDLFKFLVAFGFSASPGILNYTTWTIPARGLFIVLLPAFIYLLLKCRTSPLRYSPLAFILFILLLATHHLTYFLIPVFVSYIVFVIYHKLKSNIKFVKFPRRFVTITLIASLFIMFAIPFFTGHLISGSRYAAISNMFFFRYPRYTGVLGIFAIGGLTYLLFKHDKRHGEWFLLLNIIFLTPFLYSHTYMAWFILIYVFLLAGIALTNVAKLCKKKENRALGAIVIFLILSVSMSGFYQFLHTYREGVNERYLEESTYTTSLWIKKNIGSLTISNNFLKGVRILSISQVPLFTGSGTIDQTYGLVDVTELEFERNNITSEEFWRDGPYKRIRGQTAEGYWYSFMKTDYDRTTKVEYLSKFNLTHVIESKDTYGRWASYHGVYPSKFLQGIHEEENRVYDNGYINIWILT